MRQLVIYYSKTGTCKKIAERYEGDVVRIKPVKDIPDKYGGLFLGGFYSIFNKRMELEKMDINFDNYGKIVLISPVWAGSLSAPMKTFLWDYKFTGKDVVLVISGEGDEGNTFSTYRRLISETNNIVKQVKYNKDILDTSHDLF